MADTSLFIIRTSFRLDQWSAHLRTLVDVGNNPEAICDAAVSVGELAQAIQHVAIEFAQSLAAPASQQP